MFWGRRELSTVKHISDFLKFQTVWYKTMCFELPRGGGRTDARTDARTEEESASSSARWRDAWEWIQIKAVQKWQRGNQSQEKRGERGMWDREDRVRPESEKCMVLVGRYCYLTILPMIVAGTYWDSRFQPLILWCVLSIWRKKY